MTQKTLLVPVDFSASSTRAPAVARDLATALGAEIVLLHTFEQPLAMGDLSPLVMQQFYEEAVPAAKSALEKLAKENGIARAFVREGAAGPEIIRLAEELAPHFIVMGTHGRTGLSNLVLGSVASYVISH